MTNGHGYRITIVDSRHGAYLREPDIENEVLSPCGTVQLFCVDSAEEAIEELVASDAIISWHHIALRAPLLTRLRSCRGIVRASVGYDNIDLAAATGLRIPVCNVPDYGTEEVADHTMALILALARKLRMLDSHCRQGGWEWRTAGSVPRLRGAGLGVVGCGRIGSAVIRRAVAFGMDVAFYDPYVPSGMDKAHGVTRCETLAELLQRSLIVTLHVPLIGETRGLIGAPEFACMRSGSILVNTSRGGVIVQDALRSALERGLIGQAGLDVLSGEPDVPEWLRTSDRVLLTAHSAFYADESLSELRTKAAWAARRLLMGEPERNIINGVPSGGFQLCGALASA
jgi:D-3-phosphoglycerate dehydrogenase/C-terminal binding protein